MEKVTNSITVYFEDPFWVGVFEKRIDNELYVSKTIFGNEPKDMEIFIFVQKKFNNLKFPEAIEETKEIKKVNIKRMIRESKKQVNKVGVGTKSQQILKNQRTIQNEINKKYLREEKEINKKKRFELKQQKKKDKKRGH